MGKWATPKFSTTGVSRRHLAKGAAWTLPVVAIAATAPMAAASIDTPPPPVIDFGSACGNTGSTGKGCGGSKTVQVPLLLTNNTGDDVVFQITSMYTCTGCATPPTGPGNGVANGTRGIWSTPDFSTNNTCLTPPYANCPGGTQLATIVVPSGTTNGTYWIESASLGNASNFQTEIKYRWLNATDCTVLPDTAGGAKTNVLTSPQNC